MASLSHAASTAAPFPTPNDSHQQFSPSLLPMEPPLASPLHLPFNPSLCNVHEANILHAVPTCAAFYDHSLPGWIGGDDPLLNSSWEALDQILSDSSLSDLDHKPLGSLYSGTQRSPQFHDIGSAIAMMSNPNNVGLNLARLFSSDRGFAERAAKFSSYSQQANPAATAGYAYNRSSIVSASHPATRNSVSISPTAAFKSENAAMEVQDCRQYSDHTSEKSKGSSPESSVVSNGSKKKRAGSEKEVLEMEEDSNTVNRGKRAKRSNYENVAANRMKLTNACMKNGTSQTERKNEQSTSSISTKSDQTREISKPVVRAADAAAPTKPDVVHVRARRGQATDSHSLAERVRREKISERMKYLQDLVPGCTKVTGKAMMLDEIINYVQALQHQVEFLSMKLAAVPPSKLEFNFQSLFGKEAMKHEFRQESNPNAAGFAHLYRSYLNTPTPTLPTQQTSSYPYHQLHHDHHTPLQSENAKSWPAVNPSCSSPEVNMLIAEGQCVSNEISDVWDNDLHNNMMQMGFAQTPTPGFQGALPQYCQPMKTEKTTQDMN